METYGTAWHIVFLGVGVMANRWCGRLYVYRLVGEGTYLRMPNTQHGIDIADTPLAKVFARALEERWANRSKASLARTVKKDVKTVDRILTGITTTATNAVRELCAVLGINADAAARGEYVVIGEADKDIHKQLDALLASEHGDTLRLQIESLYHLVARNSR